MSMGNSSGGNPDPGTGVNHSEGSGASGEGAGSAMEAMRKKRQMRVNSPPEPAVTPTTPQQDRKKAEE